MPTSTATLPLQPLDQALPPELAGSGHGWLSAYRRYPVFSAAWARGRTRVLASLVTLTVLLGCLPLVVSPAAEFPWGGMVQIALQVYLPLIAGPWLGVWVRRRGWPPRREGLALAGVVLALVVGLLAFHELAAEPMKQKLAELTGKVDDKGQRKRVVLSVGLTVSSPDTPPSAPAPGSHNRGMSPVAYASNAAASALLSFWLAGGAALWGWRRERQGLAALAYERELARAQADRREAELRLSVLAAQVEPHFLFNTLAGVRSAISTDPARASEMIDRLVEYLRASIPRLRASGGSEATLGGQLDIVRAYLGLMAARMPRLHWTVDAPQPLLALPCPPLMLISLAENAVKHGVEPKIGPATINVRARHDAAGRLEVTVEDNGAGFGPGAAGSGLGLANIRERLQQMYPPGRAALTLKARPEGGVAATLSLPVEQH